MRRNGKGKSLKTPAVVRIVFLSLVAGAFGAAFVVVRNGHVKRGDEIREAELAIAACDKVIEQTENKIARLMGLSDLSRHLRWIESDLEDIDPSRILIVYTEEELKALPKVAAAVNPIPPTR